MSALYTITGVDGTPPETVTPLGRMLRGFNYYAMFHIVYATSVSKPANLTEIHDLNTDGWAASITFTPANGLGDPIVHVSPGTALGAVPTGLVSVELNATQTDASIFVDSRYTVTLYMTKAATTYLFVIASMEVSNLGEPPPPEDPETGGGADSLLVDQTVVDVTVARGDTITLPVKSLPVRWQGGVGAGTATLPYELLAIVGDTQVLGKGVAYFGDDDLQFVMDAKFTHALPVGRGTWQAVINGSFDPSDYSNTSPTLYMDNYPIVLGVLTVIEALTGPYVLRNKSVFSVPS